MLLIASGARPVDAVHAARPRSRGSLTDQERLHGLVQDVEGGYMRRVAFVVPPGSTWPLPLYELALMLAERAFEMCVELELHFVTPEAAPLAVFGAEASREVAELLADAGIVLHAGRTPSGSTRAGSRAGGDALDVERVVTLPRLEGPAIAGLPADADGFLVIDGHARVHGVAGRLRRRRRHRFPSSRAASPASRPTPPPQHIAAPRRRRRRRRAVHARAARACC